MRKLILITILALCALIGRTQTFDYQLKGWQLQTDTSYVEGDIPETIGTLFWDKGNHTISVILENGVKGQMFQEIHIYGKNTSGVAISNGMAVSLTTNPAQFATFEKTDITSISSARAFVGLATEDIGINEFGYVTISGNVRDIPTLTTGLTEKNPVYVSTTPGLLTSTMPNAPNICILVGNCERAHATQGRINVNSSIMPRLQDLSDVNGTPLTTKGQIPVWDEANNYFDFDYNIWPDLISNEGYGSSWDGVDSVAPSKNAVYDKIQSLIISGGATNLSYTASATDGKVNSDTGTDATIPAGSTTNASLMLPADKTKLNGIASGADNYGSWTLNGGGFPTTVPSGYTVNFLAGTGLSVTNSGLDLTYTNTAPMVYPGAGIPVSTGSAWGTSITDNSANWNTAYNDRLKWDGGSTGLVAATGRTSLGGTTIGQSMFTLANPSAVRFPRFNGDNTVSALSASDFKTAIGVSDYVFGVSINGGSPSTVYDGNVLNFNGGTNVTLSQSGNDITINSTGGGTGTVTSVGLSAPTGFSVTGSPVTGSGTLGLSFASGYSLPTTAKQTNWDSAYGWGNHASAGYQLKPATGALYYGTSAGWIVTDPYFTFSQNYVTYHYASGYSRTLEAATAGPTGQAGVMTNGDKTNLDAVYSNMGKVTVGGGVAYGDMSSTYFSIIGGAIIPTRDSSPVDGSSLPITSNAVYDGLALKADLSGASFTGAISSTSTMTATDFILSSDRRLKTKIRPLKNTAWVRNIPIVSYQFKSDSTETTRYGVIAQDVESVNKNLVHTDEKGNLSVSYIDLLIAKIADLEKRVSDLETQIKAKR